MLVIALGNIFTVTGRNKKNVTQVEFDHKTMQRFGEQFYC
jgi:hypothetical protein